MPKLRATTDGVVIIRPPQAGEQVTLIAGRDDEFHRWMGDGDPEPEPTGCIVVAGSVVGWVDYDVDRSWLEPGEVNIGYAVFASHRGNGYASRAVELLLSRLATDTAHTVATLLIDKENERSLVVAARTGFVPCWEIGDSRLLKRPLRTSGHQSVEA